VALTLARDSPGRSGGACVAAGIRYRPGSGCGPERPIPLLARPRARGAVAIDGRAGARATTLRKLLMMVKDPLQLPDDLPVPEDDGVADHLAGTALPPVALRATDGTSVRLDELEGRTVVFAYPRTGRPGEPSPGGDDEWDAIPGARGCTPQACSFRDEHARFAAADTRVLGLSTQDTAYQQEATERLHLPYSLLSDERLELATALGLPTFEVDGITLLKRLTLFLRDGAIESVIYPVFPPNRSAEQALARLAA
jgi:peroxiredoxin